MADDCLEKHWYALKVFFNKVFDVEAILQEQRVECFVPSEHIWVERNGLSKRIRKPIVSSLLFFRSTNHGAVEIQRAFNERVMLYSQLKGLRREPVVISDKEMNVFILVCSAGECGLEYLGDDKLEFHTGERVRVIDGPFKGAEGCIRRIKRDRRLIVSVKGICAVATSYIPQCFLQKIDS